MANGAKGNSMIEGRDIVCLALVAWDEHWGITQQLMSRLARRNRVFVVDLPVSPLSFFTGMRKRQAVWRQLRRSRQHHREVSNNVLVGSPPPILPLRYNKAVNAANALIMRRWLARQVGQIGFKDPIFWNFQPCFPGVGLAVQPSLSVYHCVDDFASLPHWWNRPSDVRVRETECCREADVVICTGVRLLESRRHLNPNIHFVPNGADVDLFATATRPETKVPDDIAGLPGKLVGFVGVIDFRLDVELLAYLATRQPDWSLVLVGPVKGDAGDMSELRKLPNVHLLGHRPVPELPAYIKAMDVCLIPYVPNEFTRHIFPLKLYEYMAAGKPVVATDMEEIRGSGGDTITITRSNEEFHRAVVDAIASDSPDRVTRRLHLARGNSWDRRVEQVSEIIGPMLRDAGRTAQEAGAAAGDERAETRVAASELR